jgi:hypothetical protein
MMGGAASDGLNDPPPEKDSAGSAKKGGVPRDVADVSRETSQTFTTVNERSDSRSKRLPKSGWPVMTGGNAHLMFHVKQSIL